MQKNGMCTSSVRYVSADSKDTHSEDGRNGAIKRDNGRIQSGTDPRKSISRPSGGRQKETPGHE